MAKKEPLTTKRKKFARYRIRTCDLVIPMKLLVEAGTSDTPYPWAKRATNHICDVKSEPFLIYLIYESDT